VYLLIRYVSEARSGADASRTPADHDNRGLEGNARGDAGEAGKLVVATEHAVNRHIVNERDGEEISCASHGGVGQWRWIVGEHLCLCIFPEFEDNLG
jgi:hypothetical protein